jgi:cell division septation protein DedD
MHKQKYDHPAPQKKNFSLKPKSNRLGFWFLIFFVSLWMFILGILVGRGTAPVKFDVGKLQKDLISLKDAVVQEKKAESEIDPDTVYHHSDFGFYEALKHSENQNGLPDIENQTQPGHRPEKPPVTAKKQATTENTAKKAEKAAPAGKSETSGSTGKLVAENSRTIQVASLKDPKMADQMVDKLIKKGYPAYRTIVKIPGKGIWFRVRIGNFKNRSEAEGTLSRLKKENLTGILLEP